MTSRSLIIGTGLKKCKPPKRARSFKLAPMAETGKELVLVARIHVPGAAASRLAKRVCLIPKFSTMASTTKSASPAVVSRLVVVEIRLKIYCQKLIFQIIYE